MKILQIISFSFFILQVGFSQNIESTYDPNELRVDISGCNIFSYHIIQNNSITISDELWKSESPETVTIKINEEDNLAIKKAINDFLAIPGDEVLVNECVMDGFSYKLKIKKDTMAIKTIYIQNFYDSRFNTISLFVNKYFEKLELDSTNIFVSTTLPVISGPAQIDRYKNYEIECDDLSEEDKIFYLTNWCMGDITNNNFIK